ncbi:hypothetical protein [Bacillus sp. B-jedd]|uniref:hypothetical protein n=1 Tax=Bacillus sp. B-jedd TaxID=1476857 RepID=UPI0005156ACE|nr:hypothetical protein [Bacillus sp. B-jedd]CEG26074.1 Hypothetical protein BN1002_00913 [Bacillus sp. B-jedd]
MGRRTKSKRFVQQGADSVARHSQRIPYRMTYAEAEARKLENANETSYGGL